MFTDSERQAQGEQTQKTQTHTFPYDSNILDACSHMSDMFSSDSSEHFDVSVFPLRDPKYV